MAMADKDEVLSKLQDILQCLERQNNWLSQIYERDRAIGVEIIQRIDALIRRPY